MSSYSRSLHRLLISPNDCLFPLLHPLCLSESFWSPSSDPVAQAQSQFTSQASLSLKGRSSHQDENNLNFRIFFYLIELTLLLRCLLRLWPSPLLDLRRLRTDIRTCMYFFLCTLYRSFRSVWKQSVLEYFTNPPAHVANPFQPPGAWTEPHCDDESYTKTKTMLKMMMRVPWNECGQNSLVKDVFDTKSCESRTLCVRGGFRLPPQWPGYQICILTHKILYSFSDW